MGIINNNRVNIVITNRVLRYTYHLTTSIDGLITHGELDLPEGTIKDGTIVNKPAFLQQIKQLVQKHKWKRKKLYFAVTDTTVVIRQLQIPATLNKEEALGYVKTQIGSSFHLPFSDPAIALEFLETDQENRDILLFAYPKEKITAFQEVFTEAGLKPAAADLTSLSVYRYYYSMKTEDKHHVLLIHWNRESLTLTVFQNDKAIFTRNIKIDTNEETLSEDRAMRTIDELMIEINRIIDFYQFSITKGEAQIDQVILSGDFPFLSAAKTNLSETVTIPVYSFDNNELPVKYTDVLGLALKQDS